MPVIQNISVPAGDDVDVTFNLDDDALVDLNGAEVIWRVYEQTYGIVSGDAVIEKTSLSGNDLEIPGSPSDIFIVSLHGSDTKGMLHNYYHEAFVMDVNGNQNTLTVGVFTVTPTEIASTR